MDFHVGRCGTRVQQAYRSADQHIEFADHGRESRPVLIGWCAPNGDQQIIAPLAYDMTGIAEFEAVGDLREVAKLLLGVAAGARHHPNCRGPALALAGGSDRRAARRHCPDQPEGINHGHGTARRTPHHFAA